MTFLKRIKRGNKIYLAEVKSIWNEGKPRHKYIRYVGKMDRNGEVKCSGKIERLDFIKIKISGQFLCLNKIAEDIGLKEILDKYTDGNKIALLVMAHCIHPTSLNNLRVLKKYDVELLGLEQDELRLSEFIWSIDRLDDSSVERIESEVWSELRRKFKPSLKSVFYDITSVYLYGKSCKLAKIGYNNKMLGLPQIKIGLAITRMDGFPIFHSIFEGNVYDSNTLEEVLLKLRENGIKDSTLVIDRGMDAKNNVLEAKKAGFDVISGVPLRGDVKRFVIDTVRNGNITDSKNAVFLSKGIIYVKEAIRDGNRLLVCVDEKRRVALKEARILAVRKAIERKMKGLPIKEGLKKYMRGNEINYSALKKAELVDSVYCILCTRKDMKKEEIIKAYFEKDRIEKAFRTLNGIVEIRPVRHWLSNRVKVHVFICYLSYLLLTVLEHKLRDSNIKDERGKLLTAERCLEELSTVYKVVMQDKLNKNTFERIVVFSKLQKKILKALGLHSQ